jgi:multisubunit Na+/H+ antiporter MnhB subunit
MDLWKAATGIILAVAGAYVAWQGYVQVSMCSSTFGQVANFFTSLFGGTGVQNCYNAQIIEIGGILVVLIGLVVIFVGNGKKAVAKKRK